MRIVPDGRGAAILSGSAPGSIDTSTFGEPDSRPIGGSPSGQRSGASGRSQWLSICVRPPSRAAVADQAAAGTRQWPHKRDSSKGSDEMNRDETSARREAGTGDFFRARSENEKKKKQEQEK